METENLRSKTEAELLALNKAVIAELNYRNTQRQVTLGAQYRPGDLIEWDSKYGNVVFGRVEVVNRKTIKVREQNADGADVPRVWNVSPSLLRRRGAAAKAKGVA
jgi:hypothetical protein